MNNEYLRKTKIVCTIGPASENRMLELMNAGMNVVRINFSHGSYPEQKEKIEKFFEARRQAGKPVALLLDMQGPEVRTGKLNEAPVKLDVGEEFTLVNEDIEGDNKKVSVSYKELYKDVKIGTKILLDDGLIELEVTRNKWKRCSMQGYKWWKTWRKKKCKHSRYTLKFTSIKRKRYTRPKRWSKSWI